MCILHIQREWECSSELQTRHLLMLCSFYQPPHTTTITISRMKYGWYHCTKTLSLSQCVCVCAPYPKLVSRSVYFNQNCNYTHSLAHSDCALRGRAKVAWAERISRRIIVEGATPYGCYHAEKNNKTAHRCSKISILCTARLARLVLLKQTLFQYYTVRAHNVMTNSRKEISTFCSTIRSFYLPIFMIEFGIVCLMLSWCLARSVGRFVCICNHTRTAYMPHTHVYIYCVDPKQISKLAIRFSKRWIDTINTIDTIYTHIRFLHHPYYMWISDVSKASIIFYSACVHIFGEMIANSN